MILDSKLYDIQIRLATNPAPYMMTW